VKLLADKQKKTDKRRVLHIGVTFLAEPSDYVEQLNKLAVNLSYSISIKMQQALPDHIRDPTLGSIGADLPGAVGADAPIDGRLIGAVHP